MRTEGNMVDVDTAVVKAGLAEDHTGEPRKGNTKLSRDGVLNFDHMIPHFNVGNLAQELGNTHRRIADCPFGGRKTRNPVVMACAVTDNSAHWVKKRR